jgi:hypothetical protein
MAIHYNQLIVPHLFCRNKACPSYGMVGYGNIIKFGRTEKGIQRYQCKTCKKTFAEGIGTVFHGRHHSPETIHKAANQAEEIEGSMKANYQATRDQLDVMWAHLGRKGRCKFSCHNPQKKDQALHLGLILIRCSWKLCSGSIPCGLECGYRLVAACAIEYSRLSQRFPIVFIHVEIATIAAG